MDTNNTYLAGTRRRTIQGKQIWLLPCITIALLLGLGMPVGAYAAPGDLDTTFSGDGKQITDFFGLSDAANGVAVQADGKIVAVGYASTATNGYDFALARYNANGNLDSNFDGDGMVTTDFQGGSDLIGAVVIQSDGKILVAGTAVTTVGGNDFALARYNPDGSPDNTFSGNGRVVTDINGHDEAVGMVIQPDGKIMVAGISNFGVATDFALARYDANGTLDTTFSTDGKQTTDFGADDVAFGMALQTDGKILAGGYTSTTVDYDFALARYNANGNLDTSFSFDGMVTTDFAGNDDLGTDVLVQADGKIVMSGAAKNTDQNFGLARYLTDGTLDTTFSGNGKIQTDFGANEGATAVLLQSDGKLLAIGFSGSNSIALARYNTNGGLDTTFSVDGKVTTVLGMAYGGAFQANGKIVVAGGNADDFILARYENDPPPTPTPTATATRTQTPTSTSTIVNTPTFTSTPLATQTPGGPTATNTSTPTNTNTPLPTQTPGGPTATPEPSNSSTPTTIVTATPTNRPDGTATPTACALQFEDVPPANTFYANVRCLACLGIINGYACGGAGEPCNSNNDPYFRPGNLVTRGQIAKIASIAAGFNEPVSGQTFEDVSPGSTFYDFIERLVGRGVMNGYTCGGAGEPCVAPGNRPYFRPNNDVTRGQTSKIVANTFFPGCTVPVR
ncbi:MAG: S-layer homology domain-containing protein [Chloroflexota bacterium]